MRTKLLQTDQMPAGEAELACADCALDPATLEMSISRYSAGGPMHLSPNDVGNPWGTGESWFSVSAKNNGGVLAIRVGSAVAVHLRPNQPYLLTLRDGTKRTDPAPFLGIAMRLPAGIAPGWQEVFLAKVVASGGSSAAEAQEQDQKNGQVDERGQVHQRRREQEQSEERETGLRDSSTVESIHSEELPAPIDRRKLFWAVVGSLLLIVACLGAAAWWFLAKEGRVIPTVNIYDMAAARNDLRQNPPLSPRQARERAVAHVGAKDLDGAFLLYKYAADRGDSAASLAMAEFYDPLLWSKANSPLPAANADLAAEWYKKAATAGDPEAQYRLGLLLESGKTTDAGGPEQAQAWLRKAADQGHIKAKEALDK